MKLNYLFDVDGTLTDPREKMDCNFVFFFINWMRGKNVFLVAGSDIEKIQAQLPASILKRCKGIFCCMGNELWIENKLIYRNSWKPTVKLLDRLLDLLKSSPYPDKKTRWTESRRGMLNFSIAGRDSNVAERKRYNKWDKETKERENIARVINKEFSNLEACLGGEISLDIQPKGHNKSLASKWIRENKGGSMVFIGDKTKKGGNDYAITEDLRLNKDGVSYNTSGAKKTQKILEEKYGDV
jgi:phosphomannomutase